MNDKFTKEDLKVFGLYAIFVIVFILLILGPKPYWIDGGVMLR